MNEKRLTGPQRLDAVDGLRGFAIAMMVLDHAIGALHRERVNPNHPHATIDPTTIPFSQILWRWYSVVGPGGFMFLAGFVLSSALVRRHDAGRSDVEIDRWLIGRGLMAIALEIPTALWFHLTGGSIVSGGVLSAFGASFVFLALARRLGDRALLACAAAIVLGAEGIFVATGSLSSDLAPIVPTILFGAGRLGRLHGTSVYHLYPWLPWFAVMAFGFVVGRRSLAKHGVLASPSPRALIATILAGGAIYALVRGAGGYGNMLMRAHPSGLHWLIPSKYPPSIATLALTAAMCGCHWLAWLYADRWRSRVLDLVRDNLIVMGRAPLLCYALHLPLLALPTRAIGLTRSAGWGTTLLAWALTLIALRLVVHWRGRARESRGSTRSGDAIVGRATRSGAVARP